MPVPRKAKNFAFLIPRRSHRVVPTAPRRGRRVGSGDGGADPAGAVRLPEQALLPADGRRQPLPARRQAPRGPRILQPNSRYRPSLIHCASHQFVICIIWCLFRWSDWTISWRFLQRLRMFSIWGSSSTSSSLITLLRWTEYASWCCAESRVSSLS